MTGVDVGIGVALIALAIFCFAACAGDFDNE